MLLLTTLLLATAALAAPAEYTPRAPSSGPFSFSWDNTQPGYPTTWPIGTPAQFGPGYYNYTTLPAGTGIKPDYDAPKFLYEAQAASAAGYTQITVRDFGPGNTVHCVDAGSYPGNGALLTLQPCNGSRGQQWAVQLHGAAPDPTTAVGTPGKIKLANSNLCWDVKDGDRNQGMQALTVWAVA
ncbi:hypothetical protein Q8F55_004902 [Vanrija albida]|uniref:Ricin B lectin domain-containing protein n=1 Tax=Vanrija albida TaxID=181172 RepID=A0ABR3Q050_9TREE